MHVNIKKVSEVVFVRSHAFSFAFGPDSSSFAIKIQFVMNYQSSSMLFVLTVQIYTYIEKSESHDYYQSWSEQDSF